MKQARCTTCGSDFDYEPNLMDCREVFAPENCPACVAHKVTEAELRAADMRRIEREAEWKRIVPAEFQSIDRWKLPDPSLLDRALAWSFGPRGLLIHGPTGVGKSRVCWQVLHREFMAGRSVIAVSAMDLGGTAARIMRSQQEFDRWVRQRSAADVLLLDDCFKTRMSDAVESALFELIDHRTAWQRPLVVTCNDVGATLAERMSADRGEPIVRRLRDYCIALAADHRAT